MKVWIRARAALTAGLLLGLALAAFPTEAPGGPGLGFNVKGSLNPEEQTRFLRTELENLRGRGVDTARIWLRLQGGTISQKTFPRDWSDEDIGLWAAIQRDFGCRFVFVVNFNDTAEGQRRLFGRFAERGVAYEFIELGNEQYLRKYARGTDGEAVEVGPRTRDMTPEKYIGLCNEYMAAFADLGLPYFVQLAPEKGEAANAAAWNRAIAKAFNEGLFASPAVNASLHLYEKSGRGDLREGQISDARRLFARPIRIAVTEFGVMDKEGPAPSPARIEQELSLAKRIIDRLEAGDVALNQLLYTDYAEPGAAVLHPRSGGLTEKGAKMLGFFVPRWL